MPGRAIISNFIQKMRNGEKQPKSCPFHCIKSCDITNSPYCIMLALYNAFNGNFEKGYAFAGSNAYRAKKITTVKKLIERLEKEFFQRAALKLKF
jgi:nitronate monooxygenase